MQIKSRTRPINIMTAITIAAACLITLTIRTKAEMLKTEWDLTKPESIHLLETDGIDSVSRSEWGWAPVKPGSHGWTIGIRFPHRIELDRTPYLKIGIKPFETPYLSGKVTWFPNRANAYEHPDGSVTINQRTVPWRHTDILIDLRRCPYALLHEPDRMDLSLNSPFDNSQFAAIESIGFAPPSWQNFFTERFQRIESLAFDSSPLTMNLILMLSFLMASLWFFAVRKLRSADPFRIIAGICIVVWLTEVTINGIYEIAYSREIILRNAGLSMEGVRIEEFGEWFKLMMAGSKIIPENAHIGMITPENRRIMLRHYASYYLYPREVSEQLDAKVLMCFDQPPLDENSIARAEETGLYFWGATSEKNYIFSRTKRKEPDDPGIPWNQTQNWTVGAGSNQASAARVLDGDMATRWDSGHPMQPGDWVEIGFDRPLCISGIRFWHYGSWNDYPRACRVLCRTPDSQWTILDQKQILLLPDGYFQTEFTPLTTTGIRLEQTGMHTGYYWSIHEVEVFTPSEETQTDS